MNVSVPGDETLSITGLPDDIGRAQWDAWLSDIGQIVEERIARDFDNERGGGKALKPISEEHEQRKAREGLELEKGHMYGDLQAELDAGGFAQVTIAGSTARITFDQESLYARAPHARWYARDFVHGGKILKFLKKDAASARQYLEARVAEWQRRLDGAQRGIERRTVQRSRPSQLQRIGGRLARNVLRTVFGV